MSGQVECDRHTLLPGGERLSVEGVRCLRGREAGILPDRPGASRIHRRARTANEWLHPRQIVEMADTLKVVRGVQGLDGNALGRFPDQCIEITPDFATCQVFPVHCQRPRPDPADASLQNARAVVVIAPFERNPPARNRAGWPLAPWWLHQRHRQADTSLWSCRLRWKMPRARMTLARKVLLFYYYRTGLTSPQRRRSRSGSAEPGLENCARHRRCRTKISVWRN